jgi:hypothetical protein
LIVASYSKVLLSDSTNGKGVKVAATSSPGTTIHTAIDNATDLDEVWLWAVNTSAVDVKLTLQYGGTTAVDNDIEFTVVMEDGLKIVLPGLLLNNTLIVKAWAGTADVIVLYGFVNRITA